MIETERGRDEGGIVQEVAGPDEKRQATFDWLMLLAGGLMGAFGLGGYLFWLLTAGLVREGNWIGVDFHVYYAAALALRNGQDIYSAAISPPYVYPPFLAALAIPLSALSVTAATIVWKVLQHLCLLAIGLLLLDLVPRRIRPLAAGALLLGLLTVPVQDEIRVGESNSLVLALIVGALWLVARIERSAGPGLAASPDSTSWAFTPASIGAGALLALAASIKVLPALLVVWLWFRGPRSVAAVATGGFVLIQLLMLAATPATARYWFEVFPGLFGQAFFQPDNQSINAFLSRALLPPDPNMPAMQLFAGEAIRPALTWLLNLLVAGAGVYVLWIASRQRANITTPHARAVSLLLEAGLVLLTTHLISGSTWLHHLVALSVPVVGLLGAWWLSYGAGDITSPRRTLLSGIALGAAFAALLHRPYDWVFAAYTVTSAPPVMLLFSSLATWVVVGMWVAVARALLQTPSRKPAEPARLSTAR